MAGKTARAGRQARRWWMPVVLAALLLLVSCGAAAAPRPASPTGRLYIANLRSSDVRVHDLTGDVAGDPAPSAFNPHEFAVVDGQVWVSNYRSAAVSRLAPDGTGVAQIPVPGDPHGLAALDGTLAITQGRRGSIALLDVATGKIRAEVATGGEPHAVAAAAGRLYAVDATGGLLLEIDPTSATVTRRLRVGDTPESLDISPGGRLIATANARSGDVTLVERDSFALRRVALPGAPVRAAFSPDGATLAVSLQDAGTLALIDPVAGKVVAEIAAGPRPDGLAFSGDGRLLYIALTGERRVAVLDLRARRVTSHLLAGDGPSGLLWVAGQPVRSSADVRPAGR